MDLAFVVIAERAPSRSLLIEHQAPTQDLIRRFSSRSVKAWDAMQRCGVACDLHLSPCGPVLCLDRAARLSHVGGSCVWLLSEHAVVSASGRAAFDDGNVDWWKRSDAFGDSEDAFVSAVRHPAQRYWSAEDALCGKAAEEEMKACPRPLALFHKVWLYDYVPRWLECEGVVVWRMSDLAKLERTQRRAFENLKELSAFAALEILYEFGGRILEPDQSPEGACVAPRAPALLLRMRTASNARDGPIAAPVTVPTSSIGMVVYINLDRCVHKRDAMDKRLFLNGSFETLDIRRFRAVEGSCLNAARMVHDRRLSMKMYKDMIDTFTLVDYVHTYPFTEGALGCSESHIRILEDVVRKNVTTLIFEDDVIIASSFEAALYRCMQSGCYAWDLLHCTPYRLKMKPRNGQHTVPCSVMPGAFAYVVTPRGARMILKSAYPIERAIDTHMNHLITSRELRVHHMVENHIKHVSVFDDCTLNSSIARTKVSTITIPRTMYVRCQSPSEMEAWARVHPTWDVRSVREHPVMVDGGVFVDAHAVRAPSKSIDYLLCGVRGFAYAADDGATALSDSIYGFEKDHPLFADGKAAAFHTLRNAWEEDEGRFLAHVKLLHRCVFA